MNKTFMKITAIIAVALMCITAVMPMIDVSTSSASANETYEVETNDMLQNDAPTSSASANETYRIEITNKLEFETKIVIEYGSEEVLNQTLGKNESATLDDATGLYVFNVYRTVNAEEKLLDTRTATVDCDIITYYGSFATRNAIKATTEYTVTYESYNPNFTTGRTVYTLKGEIANKDNAGDPVFVYKSDTITFDVLPSKNTSYAENVGSMTFSGSGTIVLNMYESEDKSIRVFDNVTLNVGIKIAHFRDFKNIECKSATNNQDGTKTYVYPLGKGQVYGIYAYGGDYVTLGMKYTNSGDTSAVLDLTAKGLMDVEGKTNKTTKAEIESVADIADIYGNADSTGWITMKNGTTTTIDTYRVFQALDSTTNNYFIEPKKNYKVISGNSVVVDDNGVITAVEDGTSYISVCYDSMNFIKDNSSINSPVFYPASSPNNAFVLVVTVNSDGKSPVLDSGIKVNEGMNDTTMKLSGDYVDSDIDIFYYYGTEGYRYSFTPAAGSKVTVYNPVLDSNTVIGFDTGTVSQDGGIFTAILKDGRNIIKIENNGKTVYQVIRAKEVSIEVENTTSPERVDVGEVLPGDVLEITLKGVTGLQKMAGIYNPTSSLLIQDNYGTTITVTCIQYKMGVGDITFNVTVPDEASGTFSFFGYISDKGWGDPTGAHHLLDSEIGKGVNFDAKLREMFNSHLDTYVLKVDNIVRFHNGEEDVKELVVKDGEMKEPQTPSAEGKLFCGWHVDSVGGTVWNFSDKVDRNLDLYASWADIKTDEIVVVESDGSGNAEISIPADIEDIRGIAVVSGSRETSVLFTGDDLASIAGKEVILSIIESSSQFRGTYGNASEDIGELGNSFSISLTVNGMKSDIRYNVVREYDESKGTPAIYSVSSEGRELINAEIDHDNHTISFTANKDNSYELRYKENPVNSDNTAVIIAIAASLLMILIGAFCVVKLRK